MKERLKNVIKWFLIILGILYLIQVVFVSGAIISIIGLSKIDFNKINKLTTRNSLQSVIEQIENYKTKNNKLPSDLSEIKTKKNSKYEYTVSKDGACYTVSETTKDNVVKEFKRCSSSSQNSSMDSQSYTEYTK